MSKSGVLDCDTQGRESVVDYIRASLRRTAMSCTANLQMLKIRQTRNGRHEALNVSSSMEQRRILPNQQIHRLPVTIARATPAPIPTTLYLRLPHECSLLTTPRIDQRRHHRIQSPRNTKRQGLDMPSDPSQRCQSGWLSKSSCSEGDGEGFECVSSDVFTHAVAYESQC